MNSKKILNVRVDFDMDMKEVLLKIEKYISDEGIHHICTTNPEFIMDAQKDELFMNIINDSDLSLPDGVGVLMAYDYLKEIENVKKDIFYNLKCLSIGIKVGIKSLVSNEKTITGVELSKALCELSVQKGYSIFLLGGWPKDMYGNRLNLDKDFATITADTLKLKYPGIKIIGSTSQFSRNEPDDIHTIDYIKDCMKKENISKVDILLVAYNHNHQEKWIKRNSSSIPATVSIGVGGTFDYLSNFVNDSPIIAKRFKLGWLFRLVTQPWRFKRIIKAFPLFPINVYIHSIK